MLAAVSPVHVTTPQCITLVMDVPGIKHDMVGQHRSSLVFDKHAHLYSCAAQADTQSGMVIVHMHPPR